MLQRSAIHGHQPQKRTRHPFPQRGNMGGVMLSLRAMVDGSCTTSHCRRIGHGQDWEGGEMTRQEILRRYPNASPSFIRQNLGSEDSRKVAIVERGHETAPDAPSPIGKASTERFEIRYTSVRKRLLDDDNACSKFITDALRYEKVIPDDRPGICSILTTQRKCANGEAEHTVIEVYRIS